MPKIDLPLVTPMTFRSTDKTKDAKMVNCYQETVAGRKIAVKRPGKTQFTITPALPSLGQGLWVYNNNLYAVANGTLNQITGGTAVVRGTGLSTTNTINFVNTATTTSPHPYMVLHDNITGYYLDATNNFINIGSQVWNVVVQTPGSGYTTLPTVVVSPPPSGITAAVSYVFTSGSLTTMTLTNRGVGYVTAPTVTIGTVWVASASISLNDQIFYGANLYTATVGGTLGVTAPTHTSGAVVNGTATLTYAGAAATASMALNAFPANPVDGLVYLDGYVFAMDSKAQIWQSDQEDPTSWNPLNYVTAQSESDLGVAIAKHLNYLVAFKQYSTEFFYDNANAVGSVLSVNATAKLELGCASGDSIQAFEETVLWMTNAQEGGRQVAMLTGLQAVPISTPAVERFLNASSLGGVYSWSYKIAGHTFYGLVLTDQDITLVYDLKEKEWHYWTTSKAFIGGGEGYFECTFVQPFPVGDSTTYVLDAVTGNIYTISPSTYFDPFGPISVRIVTQRMLLGTYNRKVNSCLTLTGDSINDIINVRHTDDDYNSWSNYRQLDLGLTKPCLYNLGSFKRRAYEFFYTGNYPLRLENAELQLSGDFGSGSQG